MRDHAIVVDVIRSLTTGIASTMDRHGANTLEDRHSVRRDRSWRIQISAVAMPRPIMTAIRPRAMRRVRRGGAESLQRLLSTYIQFDGEHGASRIHEDRRLTEIGRTEQIVGRQTVSRRPLSALSTSSSSSTRPTPLSGTFLDTRTSSSDCDDSRREPGGFEQDSFRRLITGLRQRNQRRRRPWLATEIAENSRRR